MVRQPGSNHSNSIGVLICDDAADMRELLTRIIERRDGLHVAGEAADGVEAIAVAERLQPAVIILDLAMPPTTGLDALPQIKGVAPAADGVGLAGVPASGGAGGEGWGAAFRSFGWAREVPDPQAEETFARSKLHYELRCEGEHAAMRAMYRELLAIRREEPSLRPGAARITVRSHATARWIALRLDAPGARSLLALFNLATEERRIPLVSEDGDGWLPRFATSPGEGAVPSISGAMVALPPLSAALYYKEVV